MTKVKLCLRDTLTDLSVGLWVPLLDKLNVLVVIDEVNSTKEIAFKLFFVFYCLDLFQCEHRNWILSNPHFRLQMLTELVVDPKLRDV